MVSPAANEPDHWLRALFNDSPMAIGFSRDGTMLDANAVYVATFGYRSVEELRGTSLLLQIAPSHREQVIENIARRARGESVETTYLTRGLRRDGSEFPFEITTCRVAVPDGPLTIAFIRDVSERERATAETSAALEMFRTLSSAALEGVYVHERGKIVLVNHAGAAMVAATPEQLTGVSVLDLCTPETRKFAEASIASGSNEPYEVMGQRLDGGTIPLQIRPRVLVQQGRSLRIAIIRDLTEQKRAEAERAVLDERVRRTDKLESLGTLAAGVAHDFNNILTIIMTEAAVARGQARSGASVDENLSAIEHASERAAELCRQMLAYSGRAHIDRRRLDLSALVADTEVMLEAAVGRRAFLRHELATGLGAVMGDATQLRQVLFNLVLNSCEALATPSEILIRTGSSRRTGDEVPAGDYAWFEVIDHGSGMEPATVAKMFDPFFTTKVMGRGLGMAAVLGIVRSHRGAIDVDSAPGRGTRIRVSLPVTSASGAPGPQRESP
jgi:PAS domain S-box-containing protein